MTPPSGSGSSSAANKPSKSTISSRKKKFAPQKREKIVPRKKFPIAMREQTQNVLHQREICDLYFPGRMRDPNGDIRCGASATYTDADELVSIRDKAKLALEFYEKKARVKKSLELVKVCKANRTGGGSYGLTFTAAERGSDEGLVFRGVVRFGKALFCEVKDEIKLVPHYVGGSESTDEEGQSGQSTEEVEEQWSRQKS